MITTICLWWIGLKISAPSWYFVLLIIGLAFRFIDAVRTTKKHIREQGRKCKLGIY